MSTYVPSSSVGWLDFDAAASERVSTLLRSLEEPGTVDQLGLGSIRDAFSEMLHPGTSTIQTRLRYFIFLPWIFRQLESDRVAPGEFARRLRDREAQLIDCLRPLGPNNGVIGYTVGRDLKRLPSNIYWGGLGSWRLRRRDLSLGEYAKYAAAFGRHGPDRDDDGNVTASAISMWAPPAPRTITRRQRQPCISDRDEPSILSRNAGRFALRGMRRAIVSTCLFPPVSGDPNTLLACRRPRGDGFTASESHCLLIRLRGWQQ